MDDRIALIDENVQDFTIIGEDGHTKVRLIMVIGGGGTAIAYKAVRNESDICIVKEFYPDNDGGDIFYSREKAGDSLHIKPAYDMPAEKFDKLRKAELEKQKKNVDREVENARRLHMVAYNNNPYTYKSDVLRYCDGETDASYIVLDTADGMTLSSYLRDCGGRVSVSEAVSVTEKVLNMLEYRDLFTKEYCHGDIKADNIWRPGAGDALVLLDFGSVFRYDEYRCDVENMTEQEILEEANKITGNYGIGFSTKEYCSPKMALFGAAKMAFYLNGNSARRARELLEAYRNLNFSVDLYSTVQLMYHMLSGAYFTGCGDDADKIKGLLLEKKDKKDVVVNEIQRIMEKNAEEGYHSVAEVRDDLNLLKILIEEKAHPAVLLEKLGNVNKNMGDIEPELLCDVKEE